MKYTRKTAMILLILLSLSVQKSFSQNIINLELLVGTWGFDYEASVSMMSIQERSKLNKIKKDASRFSHLKAVYKDRKVSFMETGIYLQEQRGGRKVDARWLLNKSNHLELISPRGTRAIYEILVLSKKQLVLKRIVTDKRRPIFSIASYKWKG